MKETVRLSVLEEHEELKENRNVRKKKPCWEIGDQHVLVCA